MNALPRFALASIIVHGIAAHADDLGASYRFLTEEIARGGVLYTATADAVRGLQLPLSFRDSAAYWAQHVCAPPARCKVVDIYDAQTYTLLPQKSATGDLQTERVNIRNGSNIYDAATWQIAVMLGHIGNRRALPAAQSAYALAGNQNRLLAASHSPHNRALTAGDVFVYNGRRIDSAQRAYSFRMLSRNWLAEDPFLNTPHIATIEARNLPPGNTQYRRGVITWTDWKPISGENAWAFLIGPLQAAYLHHIVERKNNFVPFDDIAVQNALAMLPTFAAMQAPLGAIYYAPAGTVRNQGDELVDPHEVAVENCISLYAGLQLLRATLKTQIAHAQLRGEERARVARALKLLGAMIDGGALDEGALDENSSGAGETAGRHTAGLLAFFRNHAWRDGEFVQGGIADDPQRETAWLPFRGAKAVDVNTWGIAALGAARLDEWFGFGASFDNWQRVKRWGGYGAGSELWGVGFSDRDGNGVDAAGNYRQGILSGEWTAGAINAVRHMLDHYRAIAPASPHYRRAREIVAVLERDEKSMLIGVEHLRIDRYAAAKFPGAPKDFATLLPLNSKPYLYASKRYLIPFGWYANPLPSTCATAWMLMLANRFDPFAYGGTALR